MKKISTFIAIAFIALNAAITSMASPAYPYPIKYTQPDGSVITIQMHGDEFYSWVTDEDGNEIEMDDNGFYHKVLNPKTASQKQAASLNSPQRQQITSNLQAVKKTGSPHFLILLIDFPDQRFLSTHTKSEFEDMLNKPGYNTLGAIGSVAEYFSDNSGGKFTPIFDVYGPVTVSYNLEEYGKHSSRDNDNSVARALLEACYLLDDQIDFTQYGVTDGKLDNIFFYYAGYSEAEGGPKTSIWPHKWDIYSDLSYGGFLGNDDVIPNTSIAFKNAKFDGISISTYGCTSEFKGGSGQNLCGIGTFCHEFSHTLGLPDYYDTDSGSNGSSDGLFGFSLMSSGNYNGDGRIPPYYTSIDKVKMGWSSWTLLQSGSSYILDDSNRMDAYRTVLSSSGSNEYFVYEARNGQKWDEPLPTGLLIYHVRDSKFSSIGNTYEYDPGIYFKASYPSGTNPPHASQNNVPYPGPHNVTTFDNNSPSPATDWNGKWHGDEVTDIKFNSSTHQVSFTYNLKDTNTKSMSGKILDYSTGAAISGADIEVVYMGGKKSMTTGSDGSYSFDFGSVTSSAFTVSVSKSGYFSIEDNEFTHPGGNYAKDFKLVSTAAAVEGIELKRYNGTTSTGSHSMSGSDDVVGCIRFSSAEMKPFAGMKLTEISFYVRNSVSSQSAVVWFGSDQVLNQAVDPPVVNKFVSVPVSGGGLTIPEGKDIYVGYAVTGSDGPYRFDKTSTNNEGMYVRRISGSSWTSWSDDGSLLISFKVQTEAEEEPDEMYELGYSGLNLEPGKTYSKNKTVSLSILPSSDPVKSVTYYYDGNKRNVANINTGSAGDHTIKAEVTYESGKKETIIQVIKVQ